MDFLLPKTLVKNLVEKYENYEIKLKFDQFYEIEKNKLMNKKLLRISDFYNFVEATKKTQYTYFLYEYPFINYIFNKLLIPQKEKVMIDVKFKSMQYIKFDSFTKPIVNIVCQIIKSTEQKKLILDLRHNVGGNLDACIQLVDALTPEGDVLMIQYKDGEKIIKSSDIFKLFQNIYILISNQTASCSEILSMILKKRLNNVTLIGHKENYKLYTQHVIKNKLFRYSFAIADGIWTVDGEDASNLKNYIEAYNKEFIELSQYLEYIINSEQKVEQISYKTE